MTEIKEVIILAGGFGTRLKKVVKEVPKPMADINGKPFLHYLIQFYEQKGVEHIILSVGYLHKIIEDYFKDRYGKVKISYVIESEPLGTGGAIIKSLLTAQTDQVLTVNGDTMFFVEPKEISAFHDEKKADITMVIRQVEDVSRYGSVLLDDNKRITGFSEKNTSSGKGRINGGVYLINKHLLLNKRFPQRFSIEKDYFEKDYSNTKIYGKDCNGYFIDIGIPEDYAKAQKEFKTLFK